MHDKLSSNNVQMPPQLSKVLNNRGRQAWGSHSKSSAYILLPLRLSQRYLKPPFAAPTEGAVSVADKQDLYERGTVAAEDDQMLDDHTSTALNSA